MISERFTGVERSVWNGDAKLKKFKTPRLLALFCKEPFFIEMQKRQAVFVFFADEPIEDSRQRNLSDE